MKILIIEDEAITRKNIALILRMEGYETFTAADGRQGISLALEQRPDLILCDITMPDTDGYAVLNRVREDTAMRTTPFIFLTARGDRGDLRHGMNLGADDYLTKPASAVHTCAHVPRRQLSLCVKPPCALTPPTQSAPSAAQVRSPSAASPYPAPQGSATVSHLLAPK
ncbi:MAG: response regulator [Verrucomicrobia bacterium]|nr:response regulator [Verrucomicrobiota bacterium]